MFALSGNSQRVLDQVIKLLEDPGAGAKELVAATKEYKKAKADMEKTLKKYGSVQKIEQALKSAEDELEEAHTEASNILARADIELNTRVQSLTQWEEDLVNREDDLKKQIRANSGSVQQKQRNLDQLRDTLASKEADLLKMHEALERREQKLEREEENLDKQRNAMNARAEQVNRLLQGFVSGP